MVTTRSQARRLAASQEGDGNEQQIRTTLTTDVYDPAPAPAPALHPLHYLRLYRSIRSPGNITYDKPIPHPRTTHTGPGTPGKAAEKQHLPDPLARKWWVRERLDRGLGITHSSPEEVLAILLSCLVDDMDDILLTASPAVLEEVETLGLLRGYSSVVKAAACLEFAAQCLQILVRFGEGRLEALEVRMYAQGVRCGYNALWWEREILAGLVMGFGGDVGRLKLPVGCRGGVLRWMVERDEERWLGFAI